MHNSKGCAVPKKNPELLRLVCTPTLCLYELVESSRLREICDLVPILQMGKTKTQRDEINGPRPHT